MVIRVAQKFVYYFPHPVVIAKCYDDHAEVDVIPEFGMTSRWKFRVSFDTAYDRNEYPYELSEKLVLPLYIQRGLEKKCLYVDEEVR
jgi:hypothetical protein